MRTLLCLLLLATLEVHAAGVTIEGVRVWDGPDTTRVVFDLSGPVDHTLFQLEGPDRVVLDLDNATASALDSAASGELISQIRSAPRNRDDLRVVLDLDRKVKAKSFLVRPHEQYGHRLVIDLAPVTSAAAEREPAKSVQDIRPEAREIVIAVDAGHGGDDPGAIGYRGTREKDVTLAIARELARQINAQPGMKALLIRDGDYYPENSARRELARKHNADMFLSIHADAFKDARAKGASVYAVSENGASSYSARLLAERENASDLVGGVSLSDKDDLVRSVLVDLSQTATMSASLRVGEAVLENLGKVTRVHSNRVHQAGFIVLKALDVPSLLIETGYISNPTDEKNLKSSDHQRKLAGAIVQGVKKYFTENPPPDTLYARWQGRSGGEIARHAVSRGETLSGIARRYNVSLQTLRVANGKTSDTLSVGETLVIPFGT